VRRIGPAAMRGAQPRPPASARARRPASAARRTATSASPALRAEPPASAALPSVSSKRGLSAYAAALAITTAWTLALWFLAEPLEKTALVVGVLLLLALGPAALAFGVAYFVRLGDKMAVESRPAADPHAPVWPALRAVAVASQATNVVRAEFTAAAAAVDLARADLSALREALSGEHEAIGAASATLAQNALADHFGAGRRDLGVLSRALDAQLAAAAELIGARVSQVEAASRQAAAQFADADSAMRSGAETLASALGPAAVAARETASAMLDPAPNRAPQLREEVQPRLLALSRSVRSEREGFVAAAAAHAAKLQDHVRQLGRSVLNMSHGAQSAGAALQDPRTPRAATAEAPPMAQAAPQLAELAPAKPELPARQAVRQSPQASDYPLVTARGVGGRVGFDGARVLVDRTQSASFVLHGAGGQRSIQLAEIVKIRLVPARRGTHGYLQFILSHGRAGRGGPADVNSILFAAAEQPQFQDLAKALQRAMRDLHRRPAVSDPGSPGEMAHLMNLRGRGLIDAEEFAAASARLEASKGRRRGWARRNPS